MKKRIGRVATITVMLGELTKKLSTSKIKKGTTLGAFLEDNGTTHSSAVRVNAKAQKKSYVLKQGDIVTIVGEVSGG